MVVRRKRDDKEEKQSFLSSFREPPRVSFDTVSIAKDCHT